MVDYRDLLQFLKEVTGYSRDLGGDRDIICRCPFCGDSVKHKNKGHLYLSKTLGVYHCFRCNEAGPVQYLLQLLGYQGRSPFTVQLIKKQSIRNLIPKKVRQVILPPPGELDQHKIRYLQQRGVDVSRDVEYRIVWNLDTFLRANEMQVNLDNSLYETFCRDYVGFLTYAGYQIILRDTTNQNKFRYFKLPLATKLDYYLLDQLSYTSRPTIVLCEGPIDVIHAEKKIHVDNAVYVACGRKGYVSTCQWTMWVLGLTKPNVIVVLDADNKHVRFKTLKMLANQVKYIIPEQDDIAATDRLYEVA